VSSKFFTSFSMKTVAQ